MTGILPIKKYGNQSAVSNFLEYTMLTPKKLTKYVGFTEPEVRVLCEQNNMDFEEMKHWYDGYSFNRLQSVYSPNSVMQAIKNEEFGSYWTRTETYESLKIYIKRKRADAHAGHQVSDLVTYIDMNLNGLKEAIVKMLGGEKVRIMTGSFQNDMMTIKSRNDILTLMVHLGYLGYDSMKKAVFIPNEEVREEFVLAVTNSRHTELTNLVMSSDRLLEQTLNMNERAVESAIEEAHKVVSSPLNYNKEESLRSTIRFAYISCLEEFIVVDEFPSGIGYADMVFMPKKGTDRPVIVLELKWDKTCEGAIEQIKNRDYPHAFKGYGGDIYLVGINYDKDTKKHSCKIEKWQKAK